MTFDEAMEWQANFCDTSGAPRAGACCRALAATLDTTSATGRRARSWPGDPIRDALPLRLVAPFHALHRRGELASIEDRDALRAAIARHDEWIVRWLDGPPQTNEAARSATFMAALLTLAAKFGLPFELLEIGSSAGLNLLIDRYGYNLGGVRAGPHDSPVLISPEWRGPPPPSAEISIRSVRGVDIAPIDVNDGEAAERLIAFAWIDAPQRVARIEASIAMLAETPVDLVQGDAADWVEDALKQPQDEGVTRVLMQSVVWPYLDDARRNRIIAALEAEGSKATTSCPLAWVRMEWDTGHTPHRIRVRTWPNGEDRLLGSTHPHAAWIEWLT